MRRQVNIIVLILCYSNIFASINVDSLEKIINNSKGKDRIDLYNQYSKNIINDDPEGSLKLAKEAYKAAGKLKYTEGEVQAILNIGYYYTWNYQDSIALLQYQKAYELSSNAKYLQGKAESLMLQGISFYYLNNYDKALSISLEAFESAKGLKDKNLQAKILQNIGNCYRKKNEFQKALEYYNQGLEIRISLKDEEEIAKSYNQIGILYYEMGNYDNAIENYKKVLEINKKINDEYGIGIALNNIGKSYLAKEDFTSAMKAFQDASKYFEKIGKQKEEAICLNNIGAINDQTENYDEAIGYYKKSLEINIKIGNKTEIASNYDNIAIAYSTKIGGQLQQKYGTQWTDSLRNHLSDSIIKKCDTIINYYNQALVIEREIGDVQQIARTLNNLGLIYSYKTKYDDALKVYNESLHLLEQIGDSSLILSSIAGMAKIYHWKGNYDKCLNLLLQNLDNAKKLNNIEILGYYYEYLSYVYMAIGNSGEALKYHILWLDSKEKLFNEDKLKIMRDLEKRYQTEKKEAQLKLQDVDLKLKASTIKRQNLTIIFFIVGLIIILGFTFVLFRLNRRIQKANIELENKNEIITKQKEEITDSIRYAQRIQRAVLPSDELVRSLLPEYFVLFRPRDIVSGDFYWIKKKDNYIVVIAADCTGHGVPGAFMSMLGVSMLNEIIAKNDVSRPSLILNHLRYSVKTTLSQTGKEGEAKDGMDIAMVVIDLDHRKVMYAGANNPFYLIRSDELIETKADKMPIGIHIKEKDSFTNNEIPFLPGDTFYIFSDGYIDQFGGPDERKFLSKNFKLLLQSIQNEPMEKQGKILSDTIDEWRGNLNQIDDMMVIGVRLI